MKITKRIYVFFLTAAILMFAGCKEEFLDTKPTDKLASSVVFNTYDGALAALNGTYRLFYAFGIEGYADHSEFGQKSIDLVMDLMGEDMPIYSQGYGWFTEEYAYNQHSATKGFTEYMWDFYYNLVNNSNNILANIENIDATSEEYNYIKGQAHAIRAYAYFYLVRLYQHTYVGHEDAPAVPIYTEPTREGNPRATVEEVYTQIENDLNTSIELLGKTFDRIHKSHINQSVAQGIMARVKLTKEEWGEAVTYAQNAREDYALMDSSAYHFAINGKNGFNNIENGEWMWGFQINSEQSTIYASWFSHMDPLFMTYAYLGLQKQMFSNLYNQIPNPASDVRAANFDKDTVVTNVRYCQLKFLASNQEKFLGDYLMMRAGEMYLIEAEAQAQQGNDTQAQQVLYDLVSKRDANYTKPSVTGQELLDEIYLQRRISLWGEGFRLLDIKRRKEALDRTGGNHKSSLAVKMSLPAESDLFIFQIPEEELDANNAIGPGDQNP
jgi:hypothetical protein